MLYKRIYIHTYIHIYIGYNINADFQEILRHRQFYQGVMTPWFIQRERLPSVGWIVIRHRIGWWQVSYCKRQLSTLYLFYHSQLLTRQWWYRQSLIDRRHKGAKAMGEFCRWPILLCKVQVLLDTGLHELIQTSRFQANFAVYLCLLASLVQALCVV